MPSTTTPPTPRFNPMNDGRLSYAISQSPRLTALLPADDLAPLLATWERATNLAAAAREVPFDPADAADEVREALRTGEEVHVADVIERMTRAQAAQAARQQALAFFGSLPAESKQAMIRFFEASEDDLYAGLGDQLADVLDRAEPVDAALGGVKDAEAAIEAGVTDQWKELRDLSGEYHDIVSAYGALLKADDTQMIAIDSTRFSAALFGGLADVAPTFASEAANKLTDLRGRPVTDVPFDVQATDSLSHFRFVVENRDRLRPRIVRADEAFNPPTLIHEDPVVVAAPRTLSDRDAYTMRRIKNAAADRRAEERTEIGTHQE